MVKYSNNSLSNCLSYRILEFFIYAAYIKDATLTGLDQVIYKLGIAFIPVHFSKENNANDNKIRAFFIKQRFLFSVTQYLTMH